MCDVRRAGDVHRSSALCTYRLGSIAIACRLFVGRAMTKQERQALLRGQFDEKNPKVTDTAVNLYVKNLGDTVRRIWVVSLIDLFCFWFFVHFFVCVWDDGS